MGNHKIKITAEFSSLIKLNTNEKYNYFVSKRARWLYKFISSIFSNESIKNIFQNRLNLSNEFDDFLENNKFETIVEFGCGYSLRGFEYSLKNKDKIYIDTDFDEVVENKKQVLNNICKDYNIVFPDNYILLSIDVLHDNIDEKLKPYLKNNILFLAEGLTSYFSFQEYKNFINQIRPFLKQSQNVFFSQENFLKKHSVIYKILRKFITLLTRNRAHLKFETKEDLVIFLNSEGFDKCVAYYKNNNLLYRVN